MDDIRLTKRAQFARGMQTFIVEYCQVDRDAYTSVMARVHEKEGNVDGYTIACRSFYKATGWMTKHERDPLFNEGKLPTFAVELFRELELHFFNIDLVSHR